MGKTGMREREAGRRIVEMRNREVGALAPRSFFHRAAASLDIVLRLGIHGKLDKHRGCVNTVSFNASGNILVSGSDDRMVMLWDWEMGIAKLSFHSGHINNVFQAKFMPYTDDKTMVTCAADGEVCFFFRILLHNLWMEIRLGMVPRLSASGLIKSSLSTVVN